MKKFIIPFLTLALAMPTFTSCSDDDNNDNGGGTGGGNTSTNVSEYFEFKDSKKTAEAEKTELAKSGNTFISEIGGLNSLSVIEVLRGFENLPAPSIFEDDNTVSKTNRGLLAEVLWVKDMNATYTWDAKTKSWVESTSKNGIILIYPSKGSTTNDCKVEITGQGSNVINEGVELPKTAKVLLFSNNKQVGSADVSADGISTTKAPQKAKVKLVADSYTLEFNAEKGVSITKATLKDTPNAATISFTKGKTSLIKGGVNLAGNIDGIIDDSDNIAKMGAGFADVKILDNYAIGVKGNLGTLSSSLETLNDKYNTTNMTWNQYIDATVDLYNQNMKMILVSTKDKVKIADVIYKAVEDEYGYNEEVMFFLFADGTEASVEAYFGAGFENVVKSWENFVQKFQ